MEKKKETPENSKSIIKPFPGDVKRPQRIRQIDKVAVRKNKPVPACLRVTFVPVRTLSSSTS